MKRMAPKHLAPKRIAYAGLVLGFVAVIGGASVAPSAYAARAASVLQSLDPDNDGTVDLAEAKAAGSKVFDSLNRDHDGTLDRRELRGHLGPNELTAADPDKDGTLDKNEYLALVEQRFSAANPDNDGTLDAKELNARAGRALLRLIK
jgi:Ca2+-binding EF-hand superfamily protein